VCVGIVIAGTDFRFQNPVKPSTLTNAGGQKQRGKETKQQLVEPKAGAAPTFEKRRPPYSSAAASRRARPTAKKFDPTPCTLHVTLGMGFAAGQAPAVWFG
jgi:hypothetical protein